MSAAPIKAVPTPGERRLTSLLFERWVSPTLQARFGTSDPTQMRPSAAPIGKTVCGLQPLSIRKDLNLQQNAFQAFALPLSYIFRQCAERIHLPVCAAAMRKQSIMCIQEYQDVSTVHRRSLRVKHKKERKSILFQLDSWIQNCIQDIRCQIRYEDNTDSNHHNCLHQRQIPAFDSRNQ